VSLRWLKMGCGVCQEVCKVTGDHEDSLVPTALYIKDYQRQWDTEKLVQSKRIPPSPSSTSGVESIEEVESPIPKAFQQTRSSFKVKSERPANEAKDFWAAQDKQRARDEKERKKRAQKPKNEKQWKFKTVEKPKIEIESAGTLEINVYSVRDSKGNLREEIAGVKTRSQNFEIAKAAEEKKLAEDVERMRQKRENTMYGLDPSKFKAAQEAVSRALLKRPDDYELANNENTETLLKGMKDIFENDNPTKKLTEKNEGKFVDILQSAGVLISACADSPGSLAAGNTEDKSWPELHKGGNLLPTPGNFEVEQAKPRVFKELNLNASQFLHTVKGKDKEVFVSTVCQLLEEKPTFEEVKFNYGALDEHNVVQIAESLKKCDNLREVYFDSNDFGDSGVRALIKLMDTHKDTLTTLSMQNLPIWQNISTEILREFVEVIERSTALVKLGFDLKEFRHWEYKDRVSKALKRNCERERVARLKKKREKSME